MLNLTDIEKQTIVNVMRFNFIEVVGRYDAYKYPEDVYERLRSAFWSQNLLRRMTSKTHLSGNMVIGTREITRNLIKSSFRKFSMNGPGLLTSERQTQTKFFITG